MLHFYIFRFHEVSPEIENYHPHISVNLCKPTHKEERTSESWEIGSVKDLNSIPKMHVKKKLDTPIIPALGSWREKVP